MGRPRRIRIVCRVMLPSTSRQHDWIAGRQEVPDGATDKGIADDPPRPGRRKDLRALGPPARGRQKSGGIKMLRCRPCRMATVAALGSLPSVALSSATASKVYAAPRRQEFIFFDFVLDHEMPFMDSHVRKHMVGCPNIALRHEVPPPWSELLAFTYTQIIGNSGTG